jgi:hypothetical protein
VKAKLCVFRRPFRTSIAIQHPRIFWLLENTTLDWKGILVGDAGR